MSTYLKSIIIYTQIVEGVFLFHTIIGYMSLRFEDVAGWYLSSVKGVDFLLVSSMRKLINGEILVAFETILKVHLNSHNLFSATCPLFKSCEIRTVYRTLFKLRTGRCAPIYGIFRTTKLRLWLCHLKLKYKQKRICPVTRWMLLETLIN